MLNTLLDDIEFGDIPITVAQGWLKSLGLVYSGVVKDVITNHYNASSLPNDKIKEFLESVKVGGYKNVVIYSVPGTEWEKMTTSALETRVKRKITEYPNYSLRGMEKNDNKIKFLIEQTVEFYQVRGGRYSTEALKSSDGAYWAQAIPVSKILIGTIEVNLTKKRIFYWFDSFAELGRDLTLAYRKREGMNFVKLLLGQTQLFQSNIGGNFNRLLTTDICKPEKIWKTRKDKDANNKQTNYSYGLICHATEGDFREVEDEATKHIIAESDNIKVTMDYIRLKWLTDKANYKLIRDVTTTVHRDGTINFHTFSTQSDIEYVLSKI